MSKAVVNLTAGPEDPEAATIAYLVATAGQANGREVLIFATKEAVLLGMTGGPETVAAEGRPALAELATPFAAAGGTVYQCPVCFTSRGLDEAALLPNARVAGGAALWEWIGADDVPVFSY
ncbi:MAG: DsrE family protein [Actinobacteria bacterium]|nr:DsrE family protein [Actinomycetota bacterium]